jgi:hypothetical protein
VIVVKILVSIDESLLARIDTEARRQGLSRSAYLSAVIAQAVGAREGPGRAAHVRRALDRLDRLFATQRTSEEATHAIRVERDRA